jgi:hypothetical protein
MSGAEVITEDVRIASEALKREALAQERAAREAQERALELALAREILKRGECYERVIAAPTKKKDKRPQKWSACPRLLKSFFT